MKFKILSFLILFISFPALLFSNNKTIQFSTSVFTGIKYGEISKSIYLNNTDTIISKLDWEQKPVYQIGLSTFFSVYNFENTISFSYGIPTKSGNMYDSDWNLSGLKKTYTISQCDIVNNLDLNISFAYKTPEILKFNIKPELQIQYEYVDFHAHNGYGWYGAAEYAKVPRDYDVPWNDPLARKAKKIREIDYYRHSLFFFAGCQVSYSPISSLSLNTGFFISPYTYLYSLDTHHKSSSNVHYIDTQQGYFSKYKLTISGNYKITPLFNCFLKFDYLFGKTFYGDLYADEYSDTPTLFEKQPTSATSWNITLSTGITINFK